MKCAPNRFDPGVAREAAALAALAPLQLLELPRVAHFDAERQVLALKWERAPTLYALRRRPSKPPMLAHHEALGSALGRLHRATPAEGPAANWAWAEPPDESLVQCFAWTRPAFASRLSHEGMKLFGAIHSDAGAIRGLVELVQGRFDACLIHGDVKELNVLAARRGPVLLDWELTQRGDPAQDLGSLLADLERCAVAPESERERLTASELRAAHAAVLRGYRAIAGAPSPAMRRRVRLWTGAHLLIYAHAMVLADGALHLLPWRLLQRARKLLGGGAEKPQARPIAPASAPAVVRPLPSPGPLRLPATWRALLSTLEREPSLERDVDALAERLYTEHFAGWKPVNALVGRASGDPAFVESAALALHGPEHWESGWRIHNRAGDWRFVGDGRLELFVHPSELHPEGARVGQRVAVRQPCVREGLVPGFVYAFSPGGAIDPRAPHVRLYLNVTPTRAVALMRSLLTDPATQRLRFEAKFPSDPAAFARRDSMLVYVEPASARAMLERVLAMKSEAPSGWRRPTPFAARAVAPGVALAESPPFAGDAAQSFGQHRTRLVAEAVLGTAERSAEAWARRLQQLLRAEGIDPARPHAQRLPAAFWSGFTRSARGRRGL